jgi:glucose/arabinose dehydrogenase
MLGNLSGRGADAAPHRMDEHALTCLESATGHEGVICSVKDFGNGACLGVGQLLRDWKRLDIAHNQELSLRAATHETHDAIPDSPLRNARTDRFDIARVFETGDVGRPSGRSCITPLALIDVRSVDAGSSNSDSNLPLACRRGRHFFDSYDLGSAGGGVDDGSHEPTLILHGVMRSLPILLTALMACSDSTASGGPGGPDAPGDVALETVATGLQFPLDLASPPGDSRLFVVEKGGRIRIIKDRALLSRPFLDISANVSTGSEQGLLGIAFDPAYASNGRFVVNYTNVNGDTRISAFHVSTDPDLADAGSETVLLPVDQPFANHNGGQVVFGPDGYLYIGLGDGGSGGDPMGNGQSLGTLLGKILRIDLNGGTPYRIPPDNPFVATAGPSTRGEIWSYGLRNPWRFSFDRANGDLYIGDVGQNAFEEIDVSPAASGAGRALNFGWNRMEGTHCYPDPSASCDRTGLTGPVLDYSHSDGCSVTAGYVYRGAAIPSLVGTYFYSDYCRGWIRSFRFSNGSVTEPQDWPALSPGGSVTSFGLDSAGELYILTSEGGVYRIVQSN